jgi:hypothetical protein
VIAALRNPVGRLAFAIALSALLHAAILWLPYIHLPHAKVELPPLTARLEHLPKPAEQPAAKPEPANPITRPDGHAAIKSAAHTMSKMDKTDESEATRPFPKHVLLTFAVHNSGDGLMTGEIQHQLDISGNSYTLKATKQASGLSNLRNSDRLIQTSHGKIDEHGLQPETFEEEEIAKSGNQNQHATFDRAAKKLSFSDGNETALPEDMQDILSFMYQLSQLPMAVEFFPLPVSDATHLEQYQIEIALKENISTPMGKLRALHLRKMHAQGEPYFEIWLGLEYRLLPVKLIQVDGSGNVTEELVIADLRAADK